jgi:hypothetical protein
MTQAKYMSSGEIASLKQLHHFGLACSTYTHFTSPIRRYADVIAHRLLATSIGITPLPDAIRDKARMRDVIENLNFRHRQAQQASRASTDLWVLKYFTGKDIICNALIFGLKPTGLRCIVQQFGMEVAVRLIPQSMLKSVITVHYPTMAENIAETPDCGLYYNPELMTLTINGNMIRVLEGLTIRLCVKENKARRRWLHVELAGESKERLLSTEMIHALYPPSSSSSIIGGSEQNDDGEVITEDYLQRQQKEQELLSKQQMNHGQSNDNQSLAATNSEEVYVKEGETIDEELYKPISILDDGTIPPTDNSQQTNKKDSSKRKKAKKH